MILNALALVAGNAACLLGASEILRKVRTGAGDLDLLLFLLLRFLLISCFVGVMGIAGWLTPEAVGCVAAVSVGVLLASGAHRRIPSVQFPRFDRITQILIGLLVVRIVFLTWFVGPHNGDAVAYHLPKIGAWIQAGNISAEIGLDPRGHFPAGFELVEIWWIVFLRHDVLIEIATAEFLLLGGVGTSALARSLGLEARAAAFAGVVFAFTPGILLQLTACINDLAVAALLVTAAAMIVRGAHPLLLMVPLGLGIGVKPVVGYAIPGLLLLFVIFRRGVPPTKPSLRVAGCLAAAALVVGMSWYARNWVLYGNPAHPFSRNSDMPRFRALGPSPVELGRNVGMLVNQAIDDHATEYNELLRNISGWGGAPFAIGVLSLLVLIREESGFRRVAGAFLVSGIAIFLMVRAEPWNMRYVLYFPALLAITAAHLAVRFKPIMVLACVSLVLQFSATLFSEHVNPNRLLAYMNESWQERGDDLEPDLPPGAVGCLSGSFGWSYPLFRNDYSRRVVFLRFDGKEALLETIRRERLEWIYVAAGLKDKGKQDVIREFVAEGRLVRRSKTVFLVVRDQGGSAPGRSGNHPNADDP